MPKKKSNLAVLAEQIAVARRIIDAQQAMVMDRRRRAVRHARPNNRRSADSEALSFGRFQVSAGLEPHKSIDLRRWHREDRLRAGRQFSADIARAGSRCGPWSTGWRGKIAGRSSVLAASATSGEPPRPSNKAAEFTVTIRSAVLSTSSFGLRHHHHPMSMRSLARIAVLPFEAEKARSS
jgi:hypothetical protein